MNLTNLHKIKFHIVNDIKYQFLLFQDLIGKFDHDFSSKLNYFEKIIILQPEQTKSQSALSHLIEKEIKRSNDALSILGKERKVHFPTSIFLICGILLLIPLCIKTAFSFYYILHAVHFSFFLLAESLLITFFIFTLFWHIQRGNSSDKREATLLRYQSFLNDLQKNKHDSTTFIHEILKAQDLSMMKIDLTPAQLVSFLNVFLKNIVISTPFSNKELIQFFEDHCCQSNGEPFQNLQSMLSKYKNEDRSPDHALSQVLNKLTK